MCEYKYSNEYSDYFALLWTDGKLFFRSVFVYRRMMRMIRVSFFSSIWRYKYLYLSSRFLIHLSRIEHVNPAQNYRRPRSCSPVRSNERWQNDSCCYCQPNERGADGCRSRTDTLLDTTASQQQLDQLKRDAPRCSAKTVTVFLGIFQGGLGQFLASMLGRRRREAVDVQGSSPVSAPITVSKEPQTRTQDNY